MSDSYYAPPESITDGRFVLTGAEAHHAATVIRMQPGAPLDVFDGTGRRYAAQVTSVEADGVSGTVTAELPSNEPTVDITLACALIRQERFEWMLEKAVELGVSRIIPLVTDRTVVRVPEAKAAKKLERWRSLVLAAVKQSRRSRLPVVDTPVKLGKLAADAYRTVLVPCMRERLRPVPRDITGPVLVLVGPEGGFTDRELDAVTGGGALAVTLGPRRLRTETAAAAVLRDLLGGDRL